MERQTSYTLTKYLIVYELHFILILVGEWALFEDKNTDDL